MTTKQEIIDYIRNIEKFDIDVHDDLIQMIKDLKPRVKRLQFTEKDRTWFAYPNYQVYYNMFNEYSARTLSVLTELGEYCNKDKWHDSFKILEEAQEACQKHYEETILGALEDE